MVTGGFLFENSIVSRYICLLTQIEMPSQENFFLPRRPRSGKQKKAKREIIYRSKNL